VFVFPTLCTYFAVPQEFQKRMLTIDIRSARVPRVAMIMVGASAISRFHRVLYAFGAFLMFACTTMRSNAGQEPDLDAKPALTWSGTSSVASRAARCFPIGCART